MNITDAEQRQLIISARKDDLKARDTLLLFQYGKSKELLESLGVPEEYHDDIMQDCIISFIEAINNRSIESTQTINAMMYYITITCAKRFLKQLYKYNSEYESPECYFAAKGILATDLRVLRELLENGSYKEDIIVDEGTSIRDTEDKVIDNAVKEEYWKFVERQTPKQQDVISGRIPVDACYEENASYYAKKYNCSDSNIGCITESAKKRIKGCKLMGYLKK